MYIIVVGAGEVGSYVAELLSREGNDVAVIDVDRGRLTDVERSLDVLTIEGSGSHPHILKEAGLDRAELLVAVTSNDEANLVSAMLAKQGGVPRAVARLEAECLRSRESVGLRKTVGVDLVIDPDTETAQEILELLDYPGAHDVAKMAGGEVIVIGTRLAADAPLAGRTLSDIAAEYEPDWDFLVATITRGSETIIPRGDHKLQPNDLLRLVCKRRARRDLMQLLGMARGSPRRVMLLGGGRTAEILAHRLANRHAEVVVVERDSDRARRLAEALDGALVLEGDVEDPELLSAEDVGSFDAVIGLTGEDDANILACLYAKSAGAKETIAVLHRLSLHGLLEEIGIDAALSPRTATANGVLRFVRGGVAQVATFLSESVEVLELEVAAGSPADGTEVKALGLPHAVLLGAIVRDGKAHIARGRSQLRHRDHVIVFAQADSVDEVEKFFG